jgi:2-hydroxymuconate-semialdehyde hydrolase
VTYRNAEFTFESIPVRYIESGQGLPVLMIHGSGPGASTIGNWRKVLDPLAERFHVHAMDLVGFGQSGKKPAPPYFDFELWLRQCKAMVGQMPAGPVGVIGHSLSGALALKLAAAEPRVAAVLTTASMGAPFRVNEGTARCWTFPRDRDELRRTAELLILDKSLIDDAYIAAREKILFEDPAYGAYFESMFGGSKQAFADAAVLSEAEFARITCPVAMIHGRDDTAFPASITLAIAEKLPQADVTLIANCSHSVAFEHPAKLIVATDLLFNSTLLDAKRKPVP